MRRGLLAVAVIAALAGCSKAPGVQAPPPRWAAGPLPADLRYLEVAAADVGATCQSYGDRAEAADILACYVFGQHLVVLPSPASDPLLYRALRRHEEAHARGWPANHPLS